MKTRFFAMLLALTMTAALLCPSALAWTVTPVDMSEVEVDAGASPWAVDDLVKAADAGLIPALTGSPKYQDVITREQFAELAVQMVVTVLGGEPTAQNAIEFTDCDNEKVLLASALGIVTGTGDGAFAPKQTTNREQIATMIARAIAYLEGKTGKDLTPNAADISAFSDKDQVSGWAAEGVGTLAANGIMNGTSATTLSPQGECTVEQSVLLLYRVYKSVK